MLDPNEQVQGALRLVFERFRLSGCLSSVANYFSSNGLLFPRRKGNWDGPLEWAQLIKQRVRYILANPLYAGAYVYARTTRRTERSVDGKIRRKVYELEPEEWGVVHWDAFQGYISRAEYEANRARLALYKQRSGFVQRGRRRDGRALLSRLALCGRCGRRMHAKYSGKRGDYITYNCDTDRSLYVQPICQHFPGAQADRLVEEHLLAALTPAQIELSLAALQELERQQAQLAQQWQRGLEGARYAARLAQRRYEQVDPDNRLVARALEAQWEASLKEVQRLEDEFARVSQQKSLTTTPQQRQALLELSRDMPRLWNSPTTSWTERKDLLELLIADVTLTRQDGLITVQIRWHTNHVDTCYFTVQTRELKTPQAIIQRIADLYQSHSDPQIAQILNQEGFISAHGKPFSKNMVRKLRRKYVSLRQPHAQKATPQPVVQRIRELYQTHTDLQTAEILNAEGFTSAKGKSFTKSIVADIRRYNNIPK